MDITMPREEEIDLIISDAEIDMIDYTKRWGRYRLKLTEQDILNKTETLSILLKKAYELRV